MVRRLWKTVWLVVSLVAMLMLVGHHVLMDGAPQVSSMVQDRTAPPAATAPSTLTLEGRLVLPCTNCPAACPSMAATLPTSEKQQLSCRILALAGEWRAIRSFQAPQSASWGHPPAREVQRALLQVFLL